MMAEQLDIEEYLARQPKFSGSTYSEQHDRHRLESQFMKVFNLMKDGQWRTLGEIREAVGSSEAGISARLRDYRKREHGSYRVESRRRGDPAEGLFEYRLLKP